MNRRTGVALAGVVVVLGAALSFGYHHWSAQKGAARSEVLALMPAGASAVLFADFDQLRSAPFLAQLYAWAPRPQADPDYTQFVKETGFDYERHLARIAVAVEGHEPNATLFAIVDGKFDRQKVAVYALKSGSAEKTEGREVFSISESGGSKKIFFTFLRNDRIALTDSSDPGVLLGSKTHDQDAAEWRARFERLAGSPLFAVIRQDAAAGTALTSQAPGGLRSPELSALLNQLQWITLAGKPDNDRLRVVAEGECAAEATARQLADLLNGVLILAQAGLNDAKTRQQLDPATREAYLELLKGADVSKIDRGETKAIRLVFEITPRFLEVARSASPAPPSSAPGKPLPKKIPAPRKGHT